MPGSSTEIGGDAGPWRADRQNLNEREITSIEYHLKIDGVVTEKTNFGPKTLEMDE